MSDEITDARTDDGRALKAVMDRIGRKNLWLVVFVPLVVVYGLTANWEATGTRPYHIDAFTNAVTAWHLATDGTPVAPEMAEATTIDHQGNIGWFVESPAGPVALYPPGAPLLAAPLYALASEPLEPIALSGTNRPSLGTIETAIPAVPPATATAVISTALAVLTVASMAVELGLRREVAVISAWCLGLGTGLWSVAADQLWQHGPAALWLSLGMHQGVKHRYFTAGGAFGLAVLTRPATGIILVAVCSALALGDKRLVKSTRFLVGAIPGVALLGAYNWWIFGTPSLRGGYGTRFDERIVGSTMGSYLGNLGLGLFDPLRGLLVMSPFLLILLFGVRSAWRAAAPLERGCAVGAVLYLLFVWRAEQFEGGAGFWSYRYPLEALIVLVPLLVRSLMEFALPDPRWRRTCMSSAGAAVLLHLPSIFPY